MPYATNYNPHPQLKNKTLQPASSVTELCTVAFVPDFAQHTWVKVPCNEEIAGDFICSEKPFAPSAPGELDNKTIYPLLLSPWWSPSGWILIVDICYQLTEISKHCGYNASNSSNTMKDELLISDQLFNGWFQSYQQKIFHYLIPGTFIPC